MGWRDTMAQVLQGVMQPPAIPPSFQTPQSSIPLPPLGRFGTEALNLAGLPASIPKRTVTPAQLVRGLGPYVPNDQYPQTRDAVPPISEITPPIVPPSGSNSSPIDYSGVDPPYTYATPMNPANDPNAVPVPPPHVPNTGVFTGPAQDIPPSAPEAAPVAPWAPNVPGSTTTENSTILNPGTTVGDLMGGEPEQPSFADYMTNPIGSMVDAVQGWQYGAGPMGGLLQLVDPSMGGGLTPWSYMNWGDPWSGSGAPPWDTNNYGNDGVMHA